MDRWLTSVPATTIALVVGAATAASWFSAVYVIWYRLRGHLRYLGGALGVGLVIALLITPLVEVGFAFLVSSFLVTVAVSPVVEELVKGGLSAKLSKRADNSRWFERDPKRMAVLVGLSVSTVEGLTFINHFASVPHGEGVVVYAIGRILTMHPVATFLTTTGITSKSISVRTTRVVAGIGIHGLYNYVALGGASVMLLLFWLALAVALIALILWLGQGSERRHISPKPNRCEYSIEFLE